MATITLKGIPDYLHQKLKLRAKQNKRSLNQEALICLETMVMTTGTYPTMADMTTAPKVTAEEIGRYGNQELLRKRYPKGYRIVGPMIAEKNKKTLIRSSQVMRAEENMAKEEMSADGRPC